MPEFESGSVGLEDGDSLSPFPYTPDPNPGVRPTASVPAGDNAMYGPSGDAQETFPAAPVTVEQPHPSPVQQVVAIGATSPQGNAGDRPDNNDIKLTTTHITNSNDGDSHVPGQPLPGGVSVSNGAHSAGDHAALSGGGLDSNGMFGSDLVENDMADASGSVDATLGAAVRCGEKNGVGASRVCDRGGSFGGDRNGRGGQLVNGGNDVVVGDAATAAGRSGGSGVVT